MFEAAVDSFGGANVGVGMIEVGQDVPARRLSVLPNPMSSAGQLGTLVSASVLISAYTRALPRILLGCLQALMML